VQAPFWGVRSLGSEVSTLSLAQAYSSRMPTGLFFSHVTAAQLPGIPLPLSLEAPRTLDVSTTVGQAIPAGKDPGRKVGARSSAADRPARHRHGRGDSGDLARTNQVRSRDVASGGRPGRRRGFPDLVATSAIRPARRRQARRHGRETSRSSQSRRAPRARAGALRSGGFTAGVEDALVVHPRRRAGARGQYPCH